MTLHWLKNWRARHSPALLKQNVNVEKFKSDSGRVGALGEMFRSPTFQHAWAVVASLAPPHRDYDSKDSAIFDMGVIRGMRKAYEALQYLSTQDEKPEPIEMDWGVSEANEGEGSAPIV